MKSMFNYHQFKRTLFFFFTVLLFVGCGGSDKKEVNSNNRAPLIISNSIDTSVVGVAYTYIVVATDADDDNLTITAKVTPTWLSFDVAQGTLIGTPGVNAVGEHAVTLSVSDGKASVEQIFTITVSASIVDNTAPSISSVSIDNAVEGITYSYTFTATDAQNDELTMNAVTLPNWLSFDATTGILTGTPIASDLGDNLVELNVTDGIDLITQAFTIVVSTRQVGSVFPVSSMLLGTQAFSANYTFDTTKNQLVEQADVVKNAGFNIFKFGLSERIFSAWEDSRNGENSFYDLPAMSQYQSLADIAENEPSVRHALDLDFPVICMWTYTIAGGENFPDDVASYNEMYDLTRYLLTKYNNTGRLFLLGPWEGDWWVLGDFNPSIQSLPPSRKTAYINWVKNRQAAIEAARNETPHSNVWVGQYVEVNRVSDFIDSGYERLVNGILPEVTVDAVSYSIYDAGLNNVSRNLDAIENHANFTNYLTELFPDKKVFLGEFGFAIRNSNGSIIRTPEVQKDLTIQIVNDASEWGAPLAFYWQLFNNETSTNGTETGWWLIDDNNVSQPVYDAFMEYLQEEN
jgi:hypothetical protein